MGAPPSVSLEDVLAARARIEGLAVRTPLVRMALDDSPAEVYLKLENLQPIGSFKLRGAANVMALAGESDLRRGVWTASAGNMGQAVAWGASRAGIPCAVVVPDTAPEAKRKPIERLGARIIPVPFDDWLEVFASRRFEGLDGVFVHPFSDRHVMAGNGTIGLEILDDLPDVDAVLVPYGGGGLACGIAAAVKATSPSTKVFACEVETAAPLAASLAAGHPVEVSHTHSFVDGIGAPRVFPEMFELASRLLDGSLVASLPEVAEAVRLLVERNHVVAEGAGAASLAAARSGRAGVGTVVCVISGGNIDLAKLATILSGGVP
jgi:threonine dehydratase